MIEAKVLEAGLVFLIKKVVLRPPLKAMFSTACGMKKYLCRWLISRYIDYNNNIPLF